MSIVESILMGLVQGMTEFLPISSSGHMVVLKTLLGVETPGIGLEAAAHIGTLAAILTVYGWDILDIATSFLRGLAHGGAGRSPGFRLGLLIIIGSLPAGIIGILFKDVLERAFSSPAVAGAGFLLTGIALTIASRRITSPGRGDTAERLKPGSALGVGVAQAIAIMPGISRSGATISAGISAGLRRDEAARFSFLLSVPAVLGAAILGWEDLALSRVAPSAIAVVAVTAFVSGALSLRLLLGVLRRGKLQFFAYYCWLLGFIVLLTLYIRR